MINLSVSKTKTFLDCKAKYNYTYNIKLPRKEWEFHKLGKFVHKVLEEFHKLYLVPNTTPFNITMSECFKLALKEFTLSQETKAETKEMISNYLKLIYKTGLPNTKTVEQSFSINLDDKVNLNGFIDRVDVEDDIYHVCDYKTTKSKTSLKKDFFQLLTYAYALCQQDPSIDKVKGSYILIRHNFEYISVEFDRSQILEVKDIYLKYAEEILAETKYSPNPTYLCNYCDHVNICNAGSAVANSKFFGEMSW